VKAIAFAKPFSLGKQRASSTQTMNFTCPYYNATLSF
jgi:hypothetical protein